MLARLALAATLAGAAWARPTAAQQTQPPIASCTYETCALRVEPRGFFGAPLLVRGAAAERVARFGIAGPDLTRIVAGSDSAVAYARRFRPHQRRTGIAGLAATVLGAAAIVVGVNDANDNNVWPLSITSGLLGIYAGVEGRRAQRELARSVWWYNRALVR